MKTAHWFSLSSLVLLALACFAGCGDSVDNVQSCNDWIESVSCGNTDFSQLVKCDVYENTDCDISAYFDCLTENTKCTNDMLDASGYASCAAKATCE